MNYETYKNKKGTIYELWRYYSIKHITIKITN